MKARSVDIRLVCVLWIFILFTATAEAQTVKITPLAAMPVNSAETIGRWCSRIPRESGFFTIPVALLMRPTPGSGQSMRCFCPASIPITSGM